MATPEINARQLIKDLQYHAGPYAKYALEARKKYIELRMHQDKRIQQVYLRAIKRIAKELKELSSTGGNPLKVRQLLDIEKALAEEFKKLNSEIDDLTLEYIRGGVAAGVSYSQAITLSALTEAGIKKTPMIKTFSKINTRAVEAIYARTHKGLSTSDRIWRNSKRAETVVRNIIQEGVATGSDAKEVAQALEKYVQSDSKTMAEHYPNMMERIQSRVPIRLSYEALRLARTEMTAAFGEGTIQGGRVSPSYIGTRWVLSPSHPVKDICDTFANADHGLGKGVYPKGEEPMFPPHPNCLCTLLPVHEQPEDLVARLRDWMKRPASQPDLEEWYRDVYKSA
ncbi:retron-type reverse transcriptase [Virgibacillus sp. FSP13]